MDRLGARERDGYLTKRKCWVWQHGSLLGPLWYRVWVPLKTVKLKKKTCSGDFGFMIFGLILTSEAIVMCTRLVRLSVKRGLV
jgi:hypothetical protein